MNTVADKKLKALLSKDHTKLIKKDSAKNNELLFALVTQIKKMKLEKKVISTLGKL